MCQRTHPDTSNILPEAYEFSVYHRERAKNCCDDYHGSYDLSDEVSVCLKCGTAFSNNHSLVLQGNKNRLNVGAEAALKDLEYREGVESGIDDPPTLEELFLLEDLKRVLGVQEGTAWFFGRKRRSLLQ